MPPLVLSISLSNALGNFPTPFTCSTELDCQLSGLCVNGACQCDAGWRGASCGQLDLLPNPPGQLAYRPLAPGGNASGFWNSWGASAPIRDVAGKYHLFSTRILNDCAIQDYTYNEQLVHTVSDTLLGPYTFKNVALNTTIINPTVVKAPGGEFVLFYSGQPLPAKFHKNCERVGDNGTQHVRSSGLGEPPGPPGYVNIGCELSIAVTTDLDAPFTVKLANFTPHGAEPLFCHTNPTGWIFPNGTTLLFWRSAAFDGSNEQIWEARAPHYLGPYAQVTPGTPVLPGLHAEDPFIMRNQRGRFLLMMHMSHWGRGSNGAKAFSYNGLDWHSTDESMDNVWSSTIAYTDGSAVTFVRREEPKIYVDEQGRMAAMFNAVADGRQPSGTYVMSQAIATNASGVVASVAEVSASAPATPAWRHGWATVSDFVYSHGKNKTGVLTASEAAYLAQNYAMHTGGNCDGAGSFSPPSHEKAATANALALRKTNPAIINQFYYVVHSIREIGKCSDVDPVFRKHPEWLLEDKKALNCSNSAFQTFILDHLATFFTARDATGKPLFNAMYSDGIGQGTPEHVAACGGILQKLQARLDAMGDGQLVVINGLDAASQVADHAKYGGGSMVDHTGVLQFVNKSTGQWNPERMHDLLFNVVRAPENAGRTLEIKTWPGLLTAPMKWGNYTQDTPAPVLQKMVGEQLNPALAVFLLVAEDTHWFGYSWFWNLGDFIPTAALGSGGDSFGKQTVPSQFFPELKCPLGQPLTPPTKVSGTQWRYTRKFEHATVHVDLADQSTTRLEFASSSCA